MFKKSVSKREIRRTIKEFMIQKEKTTLYVRASDDQEWTQLNDVTFNISHKDEKGELGDWGKVEEPRVFTATAEITAKSVVKTLRKIEREGKLYYRQFISLVKEESIYRKVLRCVKYGDKVPQKHMRKYNLVVKNLKNIQRNDR